MTTGDKRMRIERWSPVLAALGLSACVTINIYFPTAAAEKAADRIIDEVWQLKNGAKVPADEQHKEAK